MGFMPASLKAFHEEFPDVEVSLVEMPLGDQIAALEAGTIQIGFGIKGSTLIPEKLKHVEVVRSPIRAVVSREHRLARARSISLVELAHEPLLALSPKKGSPSMHGEIIRQGFATRGFKTAPIRVIEGADAFRATLESGLGVTLIAEIGSLATSPDLVFKPLKETGLDLFVELHALWREDQTSQLTANFIALMLKVAPRKPNQIPNTKSPNTKESGERKIQNPSPK
jgi:DNA-binding transcriptional LysR family regulator